MEVGVAEDRGFSTGREAPRTTESKGENRPGEVGWAVKTAWQAGPGGLRPAQREGPEPHAATTIIPQEEAEAGPDAV